MKCIMPLLVILLISVCTKAQDFNDANYEYHTLDSLSIKNTDLKNILTKYQYCEMEMPYYPDYIIIIKFKDNNDDSKKGRNSDVYLQIESINVRDLKFEEFCGFFYVYETWESKRLVLVKYENNDFNKLETLVIENYPYYEDSIRYLRASMFDSEETDIVRINDIENTYENLSKDYKNHEQNMKKYQEELDEDIEFYDDEII